jgi:hypothetical protein
MIVMVVRLANNDDGRFAYDDRNNEIIYDYEDYEGK